MKNLIIGFVIGYLLCSYLTGGTIAMADVLGSSFDQIKVWIDQIQQNIS
tara:strand:+ start:1456 stop:1602 length:147 start_codon:yes stop_codon:yes gene_type:complete